MITTANPEIAGSGTEPKVFMLSEHGIGEQFVTGAAHSSLQAYCETTGNPRDYEHPLRVANILHDFVGGELSGNAYDAAALHDVAQRATSNISEQVAAVRTLRTYAQGVEGEYVEDVPKWEYMSTLLADMDKIEDCSEQGRQIINTIDIAAAESSPIQSETLSHDETIVSQETWKTKSGLVDLNDIEKLLKDVNLESALVKAAEMLDNLMHPAPNDRAVFRDVIDAESFYAPLCEAMGFDGLCMALRNEAAKIRYNRSGQKDALREAGDMLSGLRDRERVMSYVSGLFRHLLNGEAEVQTPLHDASGHGIMLGNVVLRTLGITIGDDKPWAHWRIKSDGSLASKLIKSKSGEKPADVLGVTIVVRNLNELAVTYKGLVECIKANNVVQEIPSSSRQQAYSVQGGRGYRAAVMGKLSESDIVSVDDVAEEPKDTGHQVAKAAFVYRPHVADLSQPEADVRIELQIQTKRDWLVSRIGRAAHLLYKAEAGGDHKVLKSINMRRDHLGKPDLNPNSKERGAQFRSMVELAA